MVTVLGKAFPLPVSLCPELWASVKCYLPWTLADSRIIRAAWGKRLWEFGLETYGKSSWSGGVLLVSGWKGWKGRARVMLQLTQYLGSFHSEAAKTEAGGNYTVSKRCEKPTGCDPVPVVCGCGNLGCRCSRQRKERLFSPRRAYMVLYDHHSSGEGWLETREDMGCCRWASTLQKPVCSAVWASMAGRLWEASGSHSPS